MFEGKTIVVHLTPDTCCCCCCIYMLSFVLVFRKKIVFAYARAINRGRESANI